MSLDLPKLRFFDDQWMQHALCKGIHSSLFFPETTDSGSSVYKFARTVCQQCPVQRQCLQYAVKNSITDGMWGGRSPNERRGLSTVNIENTTDYQTLVDTERVVLRHKATGVADFMKAAGRELGITRLTVARRLIRLEAFRELEELNGQ